MADDDLSMSRARLDPKTKPYFIAGKLFAIPFGGKDDSITARIKEASDFVRTMYEFGVLDPGDTFLIIGAGATGISSAITALELNMFPIVVDSTGTRFNLQARTETRWVAPYQYDWPRKNWKDKSFPSHPRHDTGLPLPWTAALAKDIATQWETYLAEQDWFESLDVRLHPSFQPETRFSCTDDVLDFFKNHVELADIRPPRLLLSTKSISREDTSMDSYTGMSYWETDPYEEAGLGLPAGQPQRVIISGGGDGALQDFLRIITRKKSAEEILDEIVDAVEASGSGPATAFAVMVNRLAAADSGSKQDGEEFHRLCWREIHRFFQRYNDAALQAGARVVQFPFGAEDNWIRLIHRGDYFSKCYFLNRFLVLFLCQYLDVHAQVYPFRANTKLKSVTPRPSNGAAGNKWPLNASRYFVELESTIGGTIAPVECTVLIIRYKPEPYLDFPAEG